MGLIHRDTFVCFDCETTGLNPESDQIVEIAVAKFTFDKVLETRKDLVNPGIAIPKESIDIHHITDQMVKDKPPLEEILPEYLKIIEGNLLVGHGISFDVALLRAAAERYQMSTNISRQSFIDTLRMARLYGDSPNNSLEMLCKHFNIEVSESHRAMSDVFANIEVFKRLSRPFKTTESLLNRLKRPIMLKKMPLGKHKGRWLREIPEEYLRWAAAQAFDNDLLFSVRHELKQRKQPTSFTQTNTPFADL